jgi:hypothetical protein
MVFQFLRKARLTDTHRMDLLMGRLMDTAALLVVLVVLVVLDTLTDTQEGLPSCLAVWEEEEGATPLSPVPNQMVYYPTECTPAHNPVPEGLEGG